MFELPTNLDDKFKDGDEALKVAVLRIQLAQAYHGMMEKAFDAQVNHSVNFRLLPEYLDDSLLDEAGRLPLERGHEKYLEYLRRLEHGIEAAIRRKGLRAGVITNPTPPPPPEAPPPSVVIPFTLKTKEP